MKKVLVTILLLSFVFAACKKSDTSNSGGFDILSSDEKDEAAKIVDSANVDLKKVRAIYKANEKRVGEELMPAMAAKDVTKVKSIASDLVAQINDGIETAKDAVKKIEEAENMDINDTYKDYLRLKREGLGKQLDAFELRRQLALEMSKNFGVNDPAQATKAQAEFKDKEEKFQKLIEEGKILSEEANQVYKDSLRKK
ncbi:MAG: hypothetical protein AAB336_00460 [Acidobacteriota bacterium]